MVRLKRVSDHRSTILSKVGVKSDPKTWCIASPDKTMMMVITVAIFMTGISTADGIGGQNKVLISMAISRFLMK